MITPTAQICRVSAEMFSVPKRVSIQEQTNTE